MQHAWTMSRGAASYFTAIRRFPMLQADEEQMLVARWREGDGAAAHRLVTSHLRLVAKFARSYRGYNLAISELVSEGNIGLIQALKRFDPDKGVRFSTYAGWWIKAAIQAYILRSWSLVKIGTTVNQKRLFFKLSKAKRRLLSYHEGDLRPDEVTLIANWLRVAEQDVVEMNRRLGRDASLNTPLNDDGGSAEWQDHLAHDGPDQESRLADNDELEMRRRALGLALTTLDERERQIFEARRLIDPPHSLERLANQLHISSERVRQLEARAFKKVRSAVHAASAPESSVGLPNTG